MHRHLDDARDRMFSPKLSVPRGSIDTSKFPSRELLIGKPGVPVGAALHTATCQGRKG